ncbi:hypothetical protein BD309DRAFT_919919 [Dichomitus squalens]|nr:hypothetical protein BD309DRAFT_919919 [Dichomitus squalens]
MPPKTTGTAELTLPTLGTMNLARAFHEQVQSLRSSSRLGKGEMQVETLENLYNLAENSSIALRELVNGYRPINRLPQELLAAIFSLVPRTHPFARDGLPTFSSNKMLQVSDLLPIVATCRRWREVALATPSLWSMIMDDSNQQAPIYTHYLHRCTRGPLRFLLGPRASPRTILLLSEQGHRVQEVIVQLVSFSTFTTIVSTPLPDLRHCTIRNCLYGVRTAPVFPSGCPSLKTLSLQAVDFVPSSGFPSLTHLIISSRPTTNPTFNMCHLFTFLSECPSLTTLYLDGLEHADMSLEGWQGSVTLQNLQRLVLLTRYPHEYPGSATGDLDVYRAFFTHVLMPSTCVIRLGELRPRELSTCLDLVGLTDGPTAWRIYPDKNFTYAQHYNVYCIQVFNTTQSRYLQLDVAIPFHQNPEDNLDLSAALAQSSVFVNARGVWIAAEAECLLRTPSPDTLLPRMSQLESLIVCRDWSRKANLHERRTLKALEAPEDTASGDLACPRLSTLRVDCLTDEDAVYMLQLAFSRAAAGHPLTRVILGRGIQTMSALGMLHQYDGAGDVVRTGDVRSDGLWDHWMSQLSPVCLDESEDCAPYWRSWRWDPWGKTR